MTLLARVNVASMKENSLKLSFVSFCILFWICLLPCALAQGAGEKTKLTADDVMDAVASGQDVDIENAVIDGSLDIGIIEDQLERDETGRPVIRSNVSIRSSEIRGNTDFSSAKFGGNAVFSFANFAGNVSFVGTVFDKYTNFSSATFNRDADFNDAKFIGNVEFISTNFKGDVKFLSVAFVGYAYFRAAIFGKSVDFTDAVFNKAVDFIDVTFTVRVSFLRTSMEYPASFEGVRYREDTVPAGLWNNVICLTVKRLTRGKVKLPEMVVTDFSQFDTGSIMDGSSNPYLRRYIDDEQWIKSWRESIWWREPLFILWEITSHCGRSIGLWCIWLSLIAFTFAIIYWRLFQSGSIAFSVSKLDGVNPGFRGCLYYSIVTLTTLGYGDIIPLKHKARLAAATEVVMGYIMLGGLVSIFAVKLATRS